ncbi:major facilitator superfamily domain-containing protein [Terfezia claveryi]|nr:major facilitator superfamily domain-containing protein [Terfezia claveryi]
MSVIWRKLKSIFTTGEGVYINEHGEEVYGKLPRSKLENPFHIFMKPTAMNYLYFFVGWMAWTMDGYDFQSVSLSISNLAVYYQKERETVAASITLTLLFRPIGAIIFGLAGDLYGRKWPMIANLIIIACLQLATAYCKSFSTFLIVRSLFGIGMGGVWGNAASMGLENMPMECRGIFSGILQQGYALGYMIAAFINLYVVPKSSHSWKALFYIGAGATLGVAVMRLFFPESRQFLEQRERVRLNPELKVTGSKKMKAFTADTKKILRTCWRKCIYACLLMALFNSMSHVSQDMYPTYMQQTKGFSPQMSSKAVIIGNAGAIIGGTCAGYYSQFFGRRATIIVITLVGAAFIPLWVLPSKFAPLAAGAFTMQFCVQGAWGVIPIHLNELSPPQFRASFPGITYQIGNMISSPMAQIASTISEHWKVYLTVGGKIEERPNYGLTQAVMMTVVLVLTAIWTACGDEARGSNFELARVAGDEFSMEKDEAMADEEEMKGEEVELREQTRN